MQKARITGWGSYLPKKILSNEDLERMVDTSDEWITTRAGIRERRIAAEDEAPSDMGVAAAKQALERGGIDLEEIELVIVATMSPDHLCPSTACLVQHKLGLDRVPAFDIGAACSGFLYGLSVAKSFIESGRYRTILFVAAEKMSAFVDYEDRSTCVLFGDGASAVVVSAEGPGLSIDHVRLGGNGEDAELITIPAGGAAQPASTASVEQKQHYLQMNGKEVFRHAVRRMAEKALLCLEDSGCAIEDVSWVVPHQANVRILDAIAKQLELPPEKIWKTIEQTGNTSAASVGIALDHLLRKEGVAGGEHLLLLAFGGGLTWGAALLTKDE